MREALTTPQEKAKVEERIKQLREIKGVMAPVKPPQPGMPMNQIPVQYQSMMRSEVAQPGKYQQMLGHMNFIRPEQQASMPSSIPRAPPQTAGKHI